MNNGINTSLINIDQLHREQQDKIERRYEIYELILKKCHNRIKNTAKLHNNMGFCFYPIPKYLYGVPLYDCKGCILYLVNALVTNGFDVRYTHPNLLYISWYGKTNKNSLNNQTKEIEFNPMLNNSNYNPSPNYNSNPSYNSNSNKSIQFNTSQPKKEYKPIEEYKPSGNFMYNKKSMNSIDKKIFDILNN